MFEFVAVIKYFYSIPVAKHGRWEYFWLHKDEHDKQVRRNKKILFIVQTDRNERLVLVEKSTKF